jgi:hypothetical protein
MFKSMTYAQFATYVRWKTRTDATTFTNAEILALANLYKDEIAKEIIKSDESYFGYEIYRDLEVNVRNYRFDDDMLGQMQYLEGKLDGTNYKRLGEYNLNTLGITTSESDILAAMAGKDPGFIIFGGEIIILSDTAIIAVADGLRMWAMLYPADFTSMTATTDISARPTTTSDGFPRQFHELLARRVIIEYKQSQDKPIPLTDTELNYDNDLSTAISSIKSQNKDRVTVPSTPYDDGSQY